MEWISTKDRLPDMPAILAYTGGLKITLTFLEETFYTPEGNKWCTPVTHWMPLPKAPKS